MIRAFCPALQARRRPAPVNTSSRRTGSGLDLGKSSVSDMCPTPRDSGRTLADQRSVLKVGHKDRLRKNGYIESFNARLRDELLNGEIFYSLREAKIVIESWRRHYNTIRPHASLAYKSPAPEAFVPAFAAWLAPLRRPAPPATLVPRQTLN